MNKKIYFQHKFIQLLEPGMQFPQNQTLKVIDAQKEPVFDFKSLLKDFLQNLKSPSVVILNATEWFYENLKSQFYYIEAAGGFIENEETYLFIHRHGRWDLPKGKLEKKESTTSAALRECEEECGVHGLSIRYQLNSTFHIYPYKNFFALKQCYWYYMLCNSNLPLTPQTEEDIDAVEWIDKKAVLDTILDDTYFTISDVVKEALHL